MRPRHFDDLKWSYTQKYFISVYFTISPYVCTQIINCTAQGKVTEPRKKRKLTHSLQINDNFMILDEWFRHITKINIIVPLWLKTITTFFHITTTILTTYLPEREQTNPDFLGTGTNKKSTCEDCTGTLQCARKS